jgi:hypothetical protein
MRKEKNVPNIELEKSLRNWSLVRDFNERLSREKNEELVPKTEEDKRRLLHQGECSKPAAVADVEPGNQVDAGAL